MKIILFFITILNLNLFAVTNSFDFSFIKKGFQDNNTLLIIGGIQGDEPGGFMSASLITTHYEIKKGSVWVVPNLNFYSIIKRNRGSFGDMNRKFANISKDDADYQSIMKIKNHIVSPEVKLILNLHDGSGYYREKHINNLFSPYRWGQCSIIDQEILNVDKYGELKEISSKVVNNINKNLLSEEHKYHIKNTNTRMGDKEMEKSLTFFAINNGKAAYANEASKELDIHERIYYHLLAIEEYMKIMGIDFERKFDLTPMAIKNIIDNDIYITFHGNKIKLPLGQIRGMLSYFPMPKDEDIEFIASNPLMTVIKDDGKFVIHYGNRQLATLKPDYLKFIDNDNDINIIVNNTEHKVAKYGEIVYIKNSFMIKNIEGLRLNIIGYVNSDKRNEFDLTVKKNEILKRYSVDEDGNLYRAEFYKDDKFVGMILIGFEE